MAIVQLFIRKSEHFLFYTGFTAQLSDPSPKPSYSSGGWPFCPLPPIGPIDFWLEAAAAPVSKLQKAAVVSVEAVAKTSSGSQTS